MMFPLSSSPMKISVAAFKLFFILLMAVAGNMNAQDSLKKSGGTRKPVATKSPVVAFDRRVLIIDSLTAGMEKMQFREDSILRILRQQEEKISSSTAEITSLRDENGKLKARLEDAQGDQLQSSHTNSILFIFNVGVAIFLLIALLWMFLRRKNEEEGTSPALPRRKAARSGEEENFDHKLERIQKLGSLRDKGLLTEDEFNVQKKQILGE